MFYTIASTVVQTVLEKFSSDALQEISNSNGLKDELNRLENTLQTVQLVLHDAESKQRKNKALHHWLLELKNAAYDAEDILDLVATDILRQQIDRKRGKRLKSTFSWFMNKVVPDRSMVNKVKDVREKLDILAEKKAKFHLSEGIRDCRIGEDRQTTSFVNKLEIYGRNEEKDLLVENIIRMHTQNDLVLYAVCGMGGIGKTTLAQLVYNDDTVKNHFELRIWVCVSDDFSVKRLTQAITESIDGHSCNVQELDALQHHLQEKLRSRRYLLILDDVWNEDRGQWDILKESLRCGLDGSVVIVTTRIEKVAIMMGSTNTHHLQYLSENDSWSLFRKRAFANRQEDDNLVEVGKKIVRKCGGVPLAVKALGSLMRFKSTKSEWEVIQNSDIWQLDEDEKGILPALRLSYDNLPYYMKQCFAYCYIFPKDYDMEKNELIQLWMANGFIPSDISKNLAQTGREIFQELVWRSFFQDVREAKSVTGKIIWGHTLCKMHDLMHDLAQSVMRHETFIMEYSNVPKNLKMLRHLSFSDEFHASLELSNVSSLRSVIMHPAVCGSYEEDYSSLFSNQKYLRVLKLQGRFSDYIFKLQLLRHLVLFCGNLIRLPESLTSLHNLQSLKLESSFQLHELHKDLKYLKNLYFLDMEGFEDLVSTPPDLVELTNLQTLPTFIVGEDSSHQIHQLKDFDLEGELTIQGLYNVRNFEDAKSANLMAKNNLSTLKLKWKIKGARDLVYTMMEEMFDEVLEGLQPNQNLKRIYISDFPGSRLPNWLSPLNLKNLKNIRLKNIKKLEHLPPLGNFHSLLI